MALGEDFKKHFKDTLWMCLFASGVMICAAILHLLAHLSEVYLGPGPLITAFDFIAAVIFITDAFITVGLCVRVIVEFLRDFLK